MAMPQLIRGQHFLRSHLHLKHNWTEVTRLAVQKRFLLRPTDLNTYCRKSKTVLRTPEFGAKDCEDKSIGCAVF